MIEFLKACRKFDAPIKAQLLISFAINLSWGLTAPIIAKLQGELWTVKMIAVYFIAKKAIIFILPFFENVSLKNTYKNVIILDTIYLVSIFTFFVNKEIFVYIEAFLMVLYALILEVFDISLTAFLVKKYGESKFKKIQYSKKMLIAIAAVTGYSVVIILNMIGLDMYFSICIFILIISMTLIYQIYSYMNHWTEEFLNSIQVEKIKR